LQRMLEKTGISGAGTVNLMKQAIGKPDSRGSLRHSVIGTGSWCLLAVTLLISGAPAMAGQAGTGSETQPFSAAQQTGQKASGWISGRVVDQTGVAAVGAAVKLAGDDQMPGPETVTDADGRFSFANVAPGTFRLTITSAGFATQTISGSLGSGEEQVVPQIVLAVAGVVTEVVVEPPTFEVAEAQIKEQEKQRALGFIPNFYVSYVPNAAPLAPKQKFELAWKSMTDPVSFGFAAVIAGVQQARNDFSGYGQGAQGYARRFGASYGEDVTSTLIGGAILPSLLKQDPRYFYKGTGSKRSRLLYAMANSVICKGDNGRWQANYSGILGGLAAGGISNLYYPAKDRNGVGLTFENALIGIGVTAAANILQEFVIKKLTPSAAKSDPGNGVAKAAGPIGKVWGTFVHAGG
jgi:hypothetical protein